MDVKRRAGGAPRYDGPSSLEKGESKILLDGLTSIIAQLEKQKTAIERALAALREVEGIAPPVSAAVPAAPATRKTTAKNRRSLGQKARWAAKKAAEAAQVATHAKAERKGGMTPEGRQRLAEATRKRWAAKRAGSAPKKTVGRKKAA